MSHRTASMIGCPTADVTEGRLTTCPERSMSVMEEIFAGSQDPWRHAILCDPHSRGSDTNSGNSWNSGLPFCYLQESGSASDDDDDEPDWDESDWDDDEDESEDDRASEVGDDDVEDWDESEADDEDEDEAPDYETYFNNDDDSDVEDFDDDDDEHWDDD